MLARSCSVSYMVYLPPQATVHVVMASGSIRVRGMTGDVELLTTDGEIEAFATAGKLVAQSTMGNIVATGVRGTEARVESTYGDVNLSFAAAPNLVRVNDQQGDVNVAVPLSAVPDQYNVQVTMRDGSKYINVEQSDDPTRMIIVDLGAGNLVVYYGAT